MLITSLFLLCHLLSRFVSQAVPSKIMCDLATHGRRQSLLILGPLRQTIAFLGPRFWSAHLLTTEKRWEQKSPQKQGSLWWQGYFVCSTKQKAPCHIQKRGREAKAPEYCSQKAELLYEWKCCFITTCWLSGSPEGRLQPLYACMCVLQS